MCAKSHVKPVEFGHSVECQAIAKSSRGSSTKSSYEMLVRTSSFASSSRITCGRTKLGVIDGQLTPVSNWREFIKMALPVAEKHNFRMMPEIHPPTRLKSKMIDDYVDFIEKEKTTPWFGLNINFGVFQNRRFSGRAQGGQAAGMGGRRHGRREWEPSKVEEMIPLLHCCPCEVHGNDDNCEETSIPYPDIIKLLVEHNGTDTC